MKNDKASGDPTSDSHNGDTQIVVQSNVSRKTRLSSAPSSSSKETKPCIVCNSLRLKRQHEPLYQICDPNRARLFLAAYSFNKDEVWERCVLYNSIGDIFAADLVSHNDCMKGYVQKFRRSLNTLNNLVNECTETSSTAVEEMLSEYCDTLNFDTTGYDLSTCREAVNRRLSEKSIEIDNRQLKQYLKQRFGEDICFTYPRDKRKSPGFFLKYEVY